MIESSSLEEQNKIYIMGSDCVGKKNLVSLLLNKGFIGNTNLTRGIFTKHMKHNTTSITLKLISDTQDFKYTQIFKNEMEDVKAVIILFSIIDQASFDHAKFLIEFIMKNITNNYMHIILCGNKYDIEEDESNVIDLSEISELLITVPNSTYFEISCKTNMNVNLVKQFLLSLDFDISQMEDYDQNEDDPAEKNAVSMMNEFSCIIF